MGATYDPFIVSILARAQTDMDKAMTIAGSSTLGLLNLITGTSPPEAVRELLLPPLDSDMAPSANPNSDPSTTRSIPRPIRTQLSDPTLILDDSRTPPSVGPGAYDSSVIPPSHPDLARTLVLCFDGTGDQFDADVCVHIFYSWWPFHRTSLFSVSQNSNIVQFFSMLKKDDKSQQMVYYQVRGGWIYVHVCSCSNSAF